jgi:hypothetical protein
MGNITETAHFEELARQAEEDFKFTSEEAIDLVAENMFDPEETDVLTDHLDPSEEYEEWILGSIGDRPY